MLDTSGDGLHKRGYRKNSMEAPIKETLAAAIIDLGQMCIRDRYYLYRQKGTLQNLENTGYTRPGYAGLYNVFIMEEVHTILSAGAGGSTKLVGPDGHIRRIFNHKYPLEYICLLYTSRCV